MFDDIEYYIFGEDYEIDDLIDVGDNPGGRAIESDA